MQRFNYRGILSERMGGHEGGLCPFVFTQKRGKDELNTRFEINICGCRIQGIPAETGGEGDGALQMGHHAAKHSSKVVPPPPTHRSETLPFLLESLSTYALNTLCSVYVCFR